MSQKRFLPNESLSTASPDWAALHAKNSVHQQGLDNGSDAPSYLRIPHSGEEEEDEQGEWNQDVNYEGR